jgi:NAD(P)-dependent dehydrogenase (short-subunit alcohol dehydrogenase family)
MMFSPAWARYQQTKLANALFTFALDRKLKSKGSSIKALLAHPGVAATDLHVCRVGIR